MSQLIEILRPVASLIPPWLKIDGTVQGFVVWYYMYNYTNIEPSEQITILSLNALIHLALHDTACALQGDSFETFRNTNYSTAD